MARRQRMEDTLKGLHLDFEIYRGVDGSRGEHVAISHYEEAAALRHFGHRMNVGEIGCYASHYSAWQRCVELREPIVIMEDDVAVDPRFPEALAHAQSAIDRAGFIRLAALSERRSLLAEPLAGGYRFVRLEKGGMGTQCYAVSPAAAKRLLQHSDIWTCPVDYYIDSFWEHGQPNYAILPYRIHHDETGSITSDIGSREPYGPQGLLDYRRHWSKQRDWLLRKIYNLRLRF